MESVDFHHARALLEWQVELGATDAICDAPLNRYEAAPTPAKLPAEKAARTPVKAPEINPVAEATKAANAAQNLAELEQAMARFEHCDLRLGARNMLFCGGNAGARVMIVSEMPNRDEDREGAFFSGASGRLLDRMFGAIGLERAENALYFTNVLPWRAPQGRNPKPDEIAMMRPFLNRHIDLANPDVVVAFGNMSCQALLSKRGISRLRGTWFEVAGRPLLPMYHPDYILRNPTVKPAVWHDLLSLKARLAHG